MKKYNIEINEEEWGVIKKERLDLDKIREAMKILDNLHKNGKGAHCDGSCKIITSQLHNLHRYTYQNHEIDYRFPLRLF